MDDRPSLSVLSNTSSIIFTTPILKIRFSFAFFVFMSGSRLCKNSPSGSGVFPRECCFMYSMNHLSIVGGTRWHSWLKNCATSRKVAGSISDGINGIFHSDNPSGRTMAMGLTQPLTEMSTRNISWGVKAAGAYGADNLTTFMCRLS